MEQRLEKITISGIVSQLVLIAGAAVVIVPLLWTFLLL